MDYDALTKKNEWKNQQRGKSALVLFFARSQSFCVSSGFVQVEIRPMMYVALTYDHRLIDGREAVTFLRKIKSVVEDPRVLLLDM